MEFNREVEDTYKAWNRFWEERSDFHLTPTGKIIIRKKKQALFSILQELQPESAIDVGSGLGDAIEVFIKSNINVIGIDISEAAVRICKKKGLPVELKRLEDVSEKYELVYSDGLVEHFSNFRPYCRMFADISTRYVLMCQSNHDSLIVKILSTAERLFKKDHELIEHPFKLHEFIECIESIGFKLLMKRNVFFSGFAFLLFEKLDNNSVFKIS